MAHTKKVRRGLLKPAMSYEDYKQNLTIIMRKIMSVENLAERDRLIRNFAEKSLFFFCVFILGLDYVDNPFGYRLCYNIQKKKYGAMWIIAREHFKSTLITKASTLWEICKNPDVTICIYSYNTDISKDFLGVIKGWIEDNIVLRRIWSDVFWANPAQGYEIKDGIKTTWTWTSSAIEVRRSRNSQEKTLEAGGLIGGQKTGYHFEKLIYDDAETLKTVDTPESIEKIYNAFKMSINTGQTDNLNLCVVGTIYAMDDLYCKLEKEGDIQPIIQSCFEDDRAVNPTPVRFTLPQLIEKKKTMSPSVWATQMLCNPREGADMSFKPEWLQYWNPWDNGRLNIGNLNVYIAVDPAGGTGRRRDFTAMWVVGIDENRNIMVLDLIRDKLDMKKKAQTLAVLYRKYRPKRIFYERVGMQSDIEYIQDYQDRYNCRFPIEPVEAKGSKLSRIDPVKAVFSNGQIWLPYNAYHVNWEGKREDYINTFITDEYNLFPTVSHDDALDSLSIIVRLLLKNELQVPASHLEGEEELRGYDAVGDYDPMSVALYD